MKPEEFNHIILPLRQELLSRAFGMTGNGEDAEDLVQEAMMRLSTEKTTRPDLYERQKHFHRMSI